MSRNEAGKDGFFAIDRRTWAKACDLGGNEAAAYLTIAQGTGGDNRFSSWSASALRQYTGITWDRAQAAIANLVKAALIRFADKHSSKRPRYELPTWDQIHTTNSTELQGWERSGSFL